MMSKNRLAITCGFINLIVLHQLYYQRSYVERVELRDRAAFLEVATIWWDGQEH